MTKLSTIYNYLQLEENLATGGQPSTEELAMLARQNYQLVVNLALPTSDNALPDERAVVESLGMRYEHIPVVWERPLHEDFKRFAEIMQEHAHTKRFVHCAANMRVSVFVALYRVVVEGWTYQSAMQDVYKIWNPNPVWLSFIREQLDRPRLEP